MVLANFDPCKKTQNKKKHFEINIQKDLITAFIKFIFIQILI